MAKEDAPEHVEPIEVPRDPVLYCGICGLKLVTYATRGGVGYQHCPECLSECTGKVVPPPRRLRVRRRKGRGPSSISKRYRRG